MTRTVTDKDLERSYLAMALLEVTTAAVEYLNENGKNQQPAILSGCVATALRHISELVGETHSIIERIEQRDR